MKKTILTAAVCFAALMLGQSPGERSRELQQGVVAQFHSFTSIAENGGNCEGTVIWSDGPPVDWTSKVVISPVVTNAQ